MTKVNRAIVRETKMRQSFDVAVVGTGAVGLAAGIALAQAGARTAVIGPLAPRRDGRTIALMDGSVRFLERLGLWQAVAGTTSPLASLAIIDDTGALFRAPPVTFHAAEIGLDAFGQNVEAAVLVKAFAAAVRDTRGLTLVEAPVTALDVGPDSVRLEVDSGTIEAALVVGADGRDSLVRAAASIRAREWSYPQHAVTAILSHDRDHRDTSTEFHTRHGPFTLVPMQGRRSSLVWLTTPAHARELLALPDEAFGLAVERQAQSMLGKMRLAGPRGSVPMSGLSVDRVTAPRIALAGEAAHVFPPIGAQGLNLGLRDVADLAASVSAFGVTDAGASTVLADYERRRGLDIRLRTAAVDALNRSLLAGLLPVDMIRGAGLIALSAFPPLRRLAMRQGLGWRGEVQDAAR